MMNGILINGENPIDIRINGSRVLAVMVNDTKMWPPAVIPPDNPVEAFTALLSCFGMGMWVDELTWNNNAIWMD